MAFTGEDLSNFDLALKTFYVDEVIRDIPDFVPFLKTIRGRTKDRPTGGRSRTATWEVETAANLSWGPLTEAGDFAAPRKGTYKNYSLSLADMSFGFEFSGHLESAGTRKDMNFFMELGEKFANDTKKTVTRLLGILIMLDGTAVLGTIGALPGSNVVTMDTGNINNILLGMRLTIRDLASGGTEQLTSAQPASGTVTNVNEVSNQFTVTDISGAAVGDFIAIYEFYGATLPNALRNVVSNTGTFQGIVRTTAGNTFASSPVTTDTSAYGDSMLIGAAHNVLKFSREEDPTADWLAITDFDSTKWYYLTKMDQVRYTGDQKKIVGGYDTVGISTGGGGTVNLTADKRAWPGETIITRPQDWFIMRPTSGLKSGWVENGAGGYLFQKTGSAANGVYADAKQGFWVERLNYGNDRPRNSLRLTGYRSI